MGGPFKGTYRPTSLNHTARVPCAPGSGPKPRGPATRGRWEAAQSAPPTPFPHARRGAGEAAGSLNRLSRRHAPQSPHRRSLGGGGGVGSTCPPFLEGISHRAAHPYPHNHSYNATMGHLPSLRTEYALGAIFGPLEPRGYHFKPLFKEFPAIFRPGTPKPNKWVGTDVHSYESWHFRLKITLGGLQNHFWAPKN